MKRCHCAWQEQYLDRVAWGVQADLQTTAELAHPGGRDQQLEEHGARPRRAHDVCGLTLQRTDRAEVGGRGRGR